MKTMIIGNVISCGKAGNVEGLDCDRTTDEFRPGPVVLEFETKIKIMPLGFFVLLPGLNPGVFKH